MSLNCYGSPPMAPAPPEAVLSARRCRWAQPLRSLSIIVGCAALMLVASCGDPCRRLAEEVCRCAVSRGDEQRCLRHVRNLAAQSASPTSSLGRERCAALEASCTCDALANGQLSACGLTELAP